MSVIPPVPPEVLQPAFQFDVILQTVLALLQSWWFRIPIMVFIGWYAITHLFGTIRQSFLALFSVGVVGARIDANGDFRGNLPKLLETLRKASGEVVRRDGD